MGIWSRKRGRCGVGARLLSFLVLFVVLYLGVLVENWWFVVGVQDIEVHRFAGELGL